ncbi:MAG: sulfur carrier protein ThiS [Acidimicrobiia bacterium]
MQVIVRNPRRELTLTGVRSVANLLRQLEIHPETVLVIVNGELVPKDASLSDTDAVEIRSVISGGSDSA